MEIIKQKITKNKNFKFVYIPLLGAKHHGGVRIIFLIANFLAKKEFKVTIICHSSAWKPIYPLSEKVKVKLINSKFFIFYLLKLYLFLTFNCKKESLCILSHWITGALYSLVPKSLRTKSLYFVQDSEEVFYNKKNILGKLIRFFVFYSYKNASKSFVVTTKYGFRKLKNILKKRTSKIELIPLGIDENVFFVDKNFKKQNKVIFFPRKGWFKGFELLREILNDLINKESLKNFNFYLISQEYQLQDFLPKSNRIKFFSISSDYDLRRIYNEAKLLVHTSKYEGICLPILESIKCGTFVILTNSFGPLTYSKKINSHVFLKRDKTLICDEIENYLLNFKNNSIEISDSVSRYTLDNFLNSFTNKLNAMY